ncbi:MAG: hypothetical protein ACFCD0_08400 [Gemmataceae bacterium]
MFAMGGIEPIQYYHCVYGHLLDYANQVACNPEDLLKHRLFPGAVG